MSQSISNGFITFEMLWSDWFLNVNVTKPSPEVDKGFFFFIAIAEHVGPVNGHPTTTHTLPDPSEVVRGGVGVSSAGQLDVFPPDVPVPVVAHH